MASGESLANGGADSELTRASSTGKNESASSEEIDSLHKMIISLQLVSVQLTYIASRSKGTSGQDVRRLTFTAGSAKA